MPQLERHVGQLGLGELERRRAACRRSRARRRSPARSRGSRGPRRATPKTMPYRASVRQRQRSLAGPVTSGSTASAGSRTSSSTSSLVTDARSDSLLLDLAGAEARGVGGHDEAADRLRRSRAQTTATSAIEPLVIHILRAVEHPVVAVAPGAGAHRGGVGAEVGLGQPEAADRLAGRHPRAATAASAPRSRSFQIAYIASEPCTETSERTPESAASSSRQARPYADGAGAGAAVAGQVHPEQAHLAQLAGELAGGQRRPRRTTGRGAAGPAGRRARAPSAGSRAPRRRPGRRGRRGREGGPTVDVSCLDRLLERGQDEQCGVRPGVVTHQADPPDASRRTGRRRPRSRCRGARAAARGRRPSRRRPAP